MNRRGFVAGCTVAIATCSLFVRHDAAYAANVLNYVESVRVHAAVVYVGAVSKVEILGRSPFGISARAVVQIQVVARGQDPASPMASLRYSTYDDQSPPTDGGMQYKIKDRATVLVFADSFEEGSPSALWQGTPAEIVKAIESLADGVEKMSDDDLDFNGISKVDRVSQLALYKSLLTTLRSAH